MCQSALTIRPGVSGSTAVLGATSSSGEVLVFGATSRVRAVLADRTYTERPIIQLRRPDVQADDPDWRGLIVVVDDVAIPFVSDGTAPIAWQVLEYENVPFFLLFEGESRC